MMTDSSTNISVFQPKFRHSPYNYHVVFLQSLKHISELQIQLRLVMGLFIFLGIVNNSGMHMRDKNKQDNEYDVNID